MNNNKALYVATLITSSLLFTAGCSSEAHFIDRYAYRELAPSTQAVVAPQPEVAVVQPPSTPSPRVEVQDVAVESQQPEMTTPKQEVAVKKIVLGTDMFFGLNSSYIKSESKGILDTLVQQIQQNQSAIQKIEIAGYADPIGQDSGYNKWLSERRANRIAKYMASKGVKYSMSVAGYGDTHLVKSCTNTGDFNALVACNEPNRRVEIKLIK
jgi:outer membrane protein OmpA-like peptidoglycan-associated protein